jgi:excisionase family DNA binding protein
LSLPTPYHLRAESTLEYAMSWPGRGLLLGVVSAGSLVGGAVLIAVGVIIRQQRMVAAGKRGFHGHAFERRWISDPKERVRHSAVVAERLDLDVEQRGAVSVAEAARRLGVSVSTVRRRARAGQLNGAYRRGRLTGVILEAD